MMVIVDVDCCRCWWGLYECYIWCVDYWMGLDGMWKGEPESNSGVVNVDSNGEKRVWSKANKYKMMKNSARRGNMGRAHES